jgi:uncharacterized protein (DUF58 family)
VSSSPGRFDWLFGRRKRDSVRPAARDDLFDEEFQRKLEYLSIVARRLYSGRTRAERRSKKTGSGIEFADHRQYTPGDDFRYLDWNVYQRHGRLLLRLFEEEEDLAVYVLLDCSRSMSIGNPPKLDYGKRIAAAVSYIALSNLDRVGVLSFTHGMSARLAPTRGKNRIFKVFQFLRPLEAEGKTNLGDAMRTFVAQNKRRGIAVLISDLYDPAGFEEGINQLRWGKFEPYVLQIFDPIEVRPPLHGDVLLLDHETGEAREVTVTPRILERYATAHDAYRKRIEDFCGEKQVPYFALETTVPFDEAILRVLRRGGMLG